MSINSVNPYANNGQLSQLEQELLWEFAKLSDKVKRAANLAKLTAESPNESLLAELRTLEKRMGLVLTLVKASVWAVIVDSQAAEEARQQQSAESAPEISFFWLWDLHTGREAFCDKSPVDFIHGCGVMVMGPHYRYLVSKITIFLAALHAIHLNM
ncbi:hypothetical protein I312_101374 [Cryptococcus bacillisporus CA1280]|uniref:uncharacterized protein n=1 Tax=Cryptococcus bacillisporus CA1280 TaxID=1296109 RepID=UPI0033661DD5